MRRNVNNESIRQGLTNAQLMQFKNWADTEIDSSKSNKKLNSKAAANEEDQDSCRLKS